MNPNQMSCIAEELPAFVRANTSLPREYVPPHLAASLPLDVWQSLWDDYATRNTVLVVAYKEQLDERCRVDKAADVYAV